MQEIEKLINEEGKVLSGDVVVVNNFFNQLINMRLLKHMAVDVRKHFDQQIDLILTIEASGLPLATAVSLEYPCNMVYAKKSKSSNMTGNVVTASVYSYTHNTTNEIYINKEFLQKGANVLIVDDFLALGNAMNGLIKLCKDAEMNIVGLVAGIEKVYQEGGNKLRAQGYDVYSLAKIEKIEDGHVVFSH